LPKSAELPDKLDKTKVYIKIIFQDNGCGISYERKQLIFNAFETSYVHGTGLGLAICENIIEKHEGKIRETGKPNEGARFEIFLPVKVKQHKKEKK
jgi:signal transduction histidine kinase